MIQNRIGNVDSHSKNDQILLHADWAELAPAGPATVRRVHVKLSKSLGVFQTSGFTDGMFV